MSQSVEMLPGGLEDVRQRVLAVEDPEISITLSDLGVVRKVEVFECTVVVALRPTSAACPGLAEMRRRIEAAVSEAVPGMDVRMEVEPGAWRPEHVTEFGRSRLREQGYAVHDMTLVRRPECPYCGSRETWKAAAHGGSVCKTPYSCRSCGSVFDELGAGACASCSIGDHLVALSTRAPRSARNRGSFTWD